MKIVQIAADRGMLFALLEDGGVVYCEADSLNSSRCNSWVRLPQPTDGPDGNIFDTKQ